ncbi:aldo/keto reductase [Bosea sp. PAMC 26642]|uniref:aldo/keto reductase n=1 Tax=Bosea sp. (strain PAMC 26642) TaxID=1792307 RepID=UPI0007704FB6|nr:aldo/keto reductase [Bosea sp. PAMC 26642]AMJ61102.1 aldo/keto reductase [Bosea sp. PAMC 26642]
MPTVPDRILLAPDLEISRIVMGLWQVADIERESGPIDPDRGAEALAAYAAAGFDTFDMADHYGTAEILTGRLYERVADGSLPGPRPRAFTKWCPAPGPMTAEIVREGIRNSRERMRTDRIDLMQFHWWMYEHPGYLDALIEMAQLREEGLFWHIGLTNFNADHLRLLLSHGLPIVSNQVSFSLLDRRAAGNLAAVCERYGVKLLAYGTLGGGFLTERWLDKPEPTSADIADWSKSKYKRFVDEIGGWPALQAILGAAGAIARKHGVSIANVATRWVLEQPTVAAVIVGARLGEREHRADNLKLFDFALDEEDHERLNTAFATTSHPPGDCGDEYRKPPFLTASGDLSHHLDGFPKIYAAAPVPGRPDAGRVDTGSIWEPLAGYSRAMRVGNQITVSGTTATHGSGMVVAPGDAAAQTAYILDKIAASIQALGGRLEDVVRTRIYLTNADEWEDVSRVHGRYFGEIRPANTMLEVSRLIGDGYRVEIEADAALPDRR